jgi:hypothetical protein
MHTFELDTCPQEPTTQFTSVATAEPCPVPSLHSVPSVSSVVNRPLFCVPDDDRATEFAEIPSVEERTRIQTWLAYFQTIHDSGNVEKACRRIAAMHGHINGHPGERGYSWRNIQNRYYLYVNGGPKNGISYGPCDWRTLRDTRKVPDPARSAVADRQVPWKFKQFWKALRARYQRAGGDKAAHRQLIKLWKTRRADIDLEIGGKQIRAGDEIPFIPGYQQSTINHQPGFPEADPLTGIPAGWSYANLNRVETDPFTTTALKIGRSAAAAFRPKVGTTRADLLYAQVYYFDDQQFDIHVNYLGVAKKAMRPWALDCLEAKSACHVANLYKPTIVDDDGTKRRLREVDTIWFMIHVLMKEGYRKDTGTILTGEHGTATLRDQYAEALSRITGGKVVFDAGGIEGAPSFAGMFEGDGGGNPRHKAPLESIRNLIRNEMSALPGAAGRNWDSSPETNVPDKGGQFRYNTQLLKAAEALPVEARQRLRLPFLEWHHFVQLAQYFLSIIDRREDHDLKHWHRCGFVVEAWRMTTDSPWLPMDEFLKLPPEQQLIIRSLLDANPALRAVKKLSPWAVRQHLRRDPNIIKLPAADIPMILGLDGPFSREITVREDRTIELRDREVNPEPMLFHACVQNSRFGEQWLKAGSKWIAYLDHITGELHLFDPGTQRASARGAYIGTCVIEEAAPLANRDALARACGAIAKIERDFLAPAARLGGEVARRNLEMRQHNADIIAESTTGRTPAAHAAETKRVRAARSTLNTQPSTAEDAALARELLTND